MKIIALGGEKQYWQDVFNRLLQLDIKIHSALIHYYHENRGPREYYDNNDIELIDGKKLFSLSEATKLLPDEHVALDEKTIKYFASIERDFYIMTDRFCYFPEDFRHRKRLFRQCLRFWLTYFENNKIDLLFIPLTPHSLSDFTAYHVAKYLGIPTINLALTAVNDHIMIRYDYRERLKVPEDFMSGSNAEEVRKEIPEIIQQKAFNEKSHLIVSVLHRNDKAQGTKSFSKEEEKELPQEENRLKKIAKKAKHNLFRKASFKGPFAMNGNYHPFVRRFYKIKDKLWFARQKKFHDSVMKIVDLNEKYIYFAMHFQPEQTSCPETEVFEDQLLAIEILAKSLPEGWKLFVKENPIQLDAKCNMFAGRHARDKTDYENILRLPNVEIINPTIPNDDIIKNAQIISTLSGTVGWEGLNIGKPCVIFANAWYSACRSAFEVDSVETAKEAIKQARTKSEDEVKLDLLKYLAYTKDVFAMGHTGDQVSINYITVPYEDLVENMAQRLKKEFIEATSKKKEAA